ncbi:MAG: hypothetical protein ACK4GR_02280 [bacterium]
MSSKIVLNTIILITLILTLPSLVYAEGVMQASNINEKLIKSISILGLGFAAGLGALGIGLLSRSFIEGIYRNPETTNRMLIWYFVAFALIEAQVLYTLFFVFQIFFAK